MDLSDLKEILRILEEQDITEFELEQDGVTLQVRTEPLPAQLVDGNQLRQALLNVIRNAVESGARGLELTAGIADGELRLTLVDDGPGMTSEEQARAFDPFYSTKAHGTSPHLGSGSATTAAAITAACR